jgi:lysophospholipase L1-like esterase
MPTINIAPKAMQNGDNVTVYKDTIGPQQQTYTFLTSQERVILKNSGSKNITYTVGSQSGLLGPSQSVEVKETISSINLTAEQGTQQFEIWADEVGSVGGANVDLSSITTQLANKASQNFVADTKNVLSSSINTNNLNISDILKFLGVKDLAYEITKKSVTNSNGYYRDFSKENTLDNTVILGTSTWDNQKITVTDVYSGTGAKFNYPYSSGDIRFLVNSVNFTLGFLVNGSDKVIIWHDGGGIIKCGHRIGGALTIYAPTLTKPSFIDNTQFYYIHLSYASSNQMNVYFYKLGDTKPTTPSLTFTYTPTTGTENVVSMSSISGSSTRVYEVSTNVIDQSQNIYYQGRWFDNTVNSKACKTTINNGSEVLFDVDLASSITVNAENMISGLPANEMPYLAVSFDGGAYTRYQISSNSITIPTPNTSRHSVRMVVSALSKNNTYVNKWTRNEGLAISSITAVGKILKTNNIDLTKQILWLGDSITEGHLMNAWDLSGMNAQLSYAHLVSHELNVLPIQSGFGGTGLLVGGDAGMPTAINSINKITNTINANDKKDTIKLIVVNLGTNDTGQNNPTGFKTAYKTYLQTLKTAYPNVPILMIKPFTRVVYEQQVSEVSTEEGCNLFTMSGTVSLWDTVHPNVSGHRMVADQLKTYILNNYNLS